jgi:hypothetical protein
MVYLTTIFNISDYIAWNDIMLKVDRKIYAEEVILVQWEVLSWHLPKRTEEKHEIPQITTRLRNEIRTRNLPNMTQGYYPTATFGISVYVWSLSEFLCSFLLHSQRILRIVMVLAPSPMEELMKTTISFCEMAVGGVGTEYESQFACYRQSTGCAVSICCGRI